MSSVEGLLLSVEKSVHLNRNNPISEHQHSFFWEALFRNFNYNFDAVYTVIDSILTVKDRCQKTPLYIQAIALDNIHFLVSNISQALDFKVTAVDNRWLLGNSADCAISMPAQSMAPHHAVIESYGPESYYLKDLGSQIGTCLNRRRLTANQRQLLKSGDDIEFGSLTVEFFIDQFDRPMIMHEAMDSQSWEDMERIMKFRNESPH